LNSDFCARFIPIGDLSDGATGGGGKLIVKSINKTKSKTLNKQKISVVLAGILTFKTRKEHLYLYNLFIYALKSILNNMFKDIT
jgi:hypothetical protein